MTPLTDDKLKELKEEHSGHYLNCAVCCLIERLEATDNALQLFIQMDCDSDGPPIMEDSVLGQALRRVRETRGK